MPLSNNQSNIIWSCLVFRLLVLLIWCALILWLSLDPSPPRLPGIFGWDKLLHALAYGLLALLVARVLVCLCNGQNHGAWWQAWLVATLFGLLLEVLQMTMHNGRTAEWGDLLADALGALVVCVLFRHAWRVNKKKPRRKLEADG
ncbi:MAG: VanZ family protein [Desulfuromonadales bacterium]|jgi:VanZ family protein|nr:VanZ family protein [Desulfuromonadales bacterium]